jgi:hypothetical protein
MPLALPARSISAGLQDGAHGSCSHTCFPETIASSVSFLDGATYLPHLHASQMGGGVQVRAWAGGDWAGQTFDAWLFHCADVSTPPTRLPWIPEREPRLGSATVAIILPSREQVVVPLATRLRMSLHAAPRASIALPPVAAPAYCCGGSWCFCSCFSNLNLQRPAWRSVLYNRVSMASRNRVYLFRQAGEVLVGKGRRWLALVANG